MPEWLRGHIGNSVNVGEVLPAMVTRVFGDQGICNLKVMLDGSDTFWATSVEHDQDTKRPSTWHWMFEGQQTRYRPDRTEAEAGSEKGA